MQFSDEIYLIKKTRTQNELKQFEEHNIETSVYCDLHSIGSAEFSDSGKTGLKASGRADVHIEDYKGEKAVRVIEKNYILKQGIYEVYRTYQSGDVIELYLREKEGTK